MTLYLSGPMRGLPKFNFPLFDEVAAALREQGYTVLSPAEHDRSIYKSLEKWPGFAPGDDKLCPAFDIYKAFEWDFSCVLTSDGIVMLPGWEKSVGAKCERFVAEQLGRKVLLAINTTKPEPTWVLMADVCPLRLRVVERVG